MSDDLEIKLEQRMNRRSFLRGSGLAAAAFVGAAAFPSSARGQAPQSPGDKPKEKPDQKESKDDKSKEDEKEGKKDGKEAKKDGDSTEKDPFKETKIDAQGREYRMCPQCGYNMYRQDRTWTCENCGYSYIE